MATVATFNTEKSGQVGGSSLQGSVGTAPSKGVVQQGNAAGATVNPQSNVLPTSGSGVAAPAASLATGGGAGAGGGGSVLDQGAINALLGRLSSLDQILQQLNASAASQRDQTARQYAEENQLARGQYNEAMDTNVNARSGGMSTSLAANAQGGRGLRSTLGSLGALSGTGLDLANRAVAQSANRDLGGINDTFETNATNLNNTWAATEQEQRNRDAELKTAYENALRKNAGDVATKRQDYFNDIGGLYAAAGDTGQANAYRGRMAEQDPAIIAAARTSTPNWQQRSAQFSPAALKTYLAGGNDMTVQTEGGDSGLTMNSPLYAMSRRRDESLA